MNAYTAGFVAKCSSKGIEPSVLVKQAQMSGLANEGLSALLNQPMLRDAASSYGATKIGEIAKLLKMLQLLKGGEGIQGAAMR